MQEKNSSFKVRIAGKWMAAFFICLAMLTSGGFMMAGTFGEEKKTIDKNRKQRMTESPNFKNGRFVNTIPAKQPPIFEMAGEWIKGAKNTKPNRPVPVVARQMSDFENHPEKGLRVTWLGHSTNLVEIDSARVLLDPVWSDRSSPVSFAGPKRFFSPPLKIEDIPSLDAVLISHDHYDHLDKATVSRLAKTGVTFIMPLGVGAHFEKWGIDTRQIVELDWWQERKVGNLTITATPARHFSGRSPVMADRDKTLWAGYAIVGPNHRVYYSGDTGMFEGFSEIGKRLGPFDVSLIEIGAYNRLWADLHLGPEQAVQAAIQAKSKLMIPDHWGTFDLALHSWTEPIERLLVASEKAGLLVAAPMPGQSIDPANPPKLVRWWPEIPWETVEVHPIVSSGLEAETVGQGEVPAKMPVNRALTEF